MINDYIFKPHDISYFVNCNKKKNTLPPSWHSKAAPSITSLIVFISMLVLLYSYNYI